MENPVIETVEWAQPLELRQAVPRQVRSSWVFRAAISIVTIVFFGLIVCSIITSYQDAKDREILKDRGVAADGKVVDLQIVANKNGQDYVVKYNFNSSSLPGGTNSINTATADVSIDVFQSLAIGQQIPIVYDPTNPARVMINSANSVRLDDPFARMYGLLEVFVPFFLILYIFITWLFLLMPYDFQRKIIEQGAVTSAITTTGVRSQKTTTGAYGFRGAYQFVDANGKTVRGWRFLPVMLVDKI